MILNKNYKAIVWSIFFAIAIYFLPTITGAAEPLFIDFGEVEQNAKITKAVNISTSSSSNVNLLSLLLHNGTDFQVITEVPDGGIVVPPNESVEIEIAFNPTNIGLIADTLIVRTDNRSIRSVIVNLSGTGISAISVEQILGFLDEAVASGTITGSDERKLHYYNQRSNKKRSNKTDEKRLNHFRKKNESDKRQKLAEKRLNAFRNMIESVDKKVQDGDIYGACKQIVHVYEKADDRDPPESSPDFVDGDGKEHLATMLVDLSKKLECN